MRTTRVADLAVLLCLNILLVFAHSANGQETTGMIAGQVSDSGGRVIAGAQITVVDVDRGIVRRTVKTSDVGRYIAPLLPIGHYRVVAEANHFKAREESGLQLSVNEDLEVNFVLPVAGANEAITVTADYLQSAEGAISGTEIRELPLNTRNYTKLMSAEPGVSVNVGADQLCIGTVGALGSSGAGALGSSSSLDYAVNGLRPDGNNWTLDGADNLDRGENMTLLTFPTVDSIEEFKVLRGNYSPEFPSGASGQVIAVTRTGTNRFHGSAYEFFRNDVLAANNFFNNRNNQQRPPLRYNNFGFTIGGPVPVSGFSSQAKNKTFFFYSEEWRRVIDYSTLYTGRLPTPAELEGTFDTSVCTQPIFDPDTGACTGPTTTQITNFDPTAAAYIQDIYLRLPGRDSDGRPSTNAINQYDFRGETLRIDHVFGPRFSIFGRFINDSIPSVEPGGLFNGSSVAGVGTTSTNMPGRGLTVRLTMMLAPTLLNEVGYAYSYGAIVAQPVGLASSAVSPDIRPVLPFGTQTPRVPDLNFYAGDGVHGSGPYLEYNRNHAVVDTLTKISNKHMFKAGFAYSHYEKDENHPWSALNGGYSFYGVDPNGQYTFEQEWASFLLGNVARFNQTSAGSPADIRQNLPEWFVQDQYRVRSNFTLTYGFRWSFFRAPTDGHGHISSFDPGTFDEASAPAIDMGTGLLVPETATPITNGLIIAGQNSPFGNAITRQNNLSIAPRLGFAWDPTGTGKTTIRVGYGLFFDNPQKSMFENSIFYNPPLVKNVNISNTNFGNPGSVEPDVALIPGVIWGIAPNWHQPYSQQWSLDVQQKFGRKTVFAVGYAGNRGLHLPGLMDINQPQPGAYLAAGVPSNGPIYGYNTQLLNSVRPYRGYGPIEMVYTSFNSNYNALQAQMQTRLGRNSQFAVNYSWSHAMTDSGGVAFGFAPPQNIYDLRAEYADAAFDRRHILSASYVYELPFYSGQRSWIGRLLGGWELSGMFFAQSGEPFTVGGTDIDPAGLGLFASQYLTPRPDQLGNPNQDAPHTMDRWFDTSVFVPPPPDEIRPGNARPNSVRGPGEIRLDAALLKDIGIAESASLQFRVEATNALNHTNPYGIAAWFPDQTNFGRVVSARGPRIVQLGLKLLF